MSIHPGEEKIYTDTQRPIVDAPEQTPTPNSSRTPEQKKTWLRRYAKRMGIVAVSSMVVPAGIAAVIIKANGSEGKPIPDLSDTQNNLDTGVIQPGLGDGGSVELEDGTVVSIPETVATTLPTFNNIPRPEVPLDSIEQNSFNLMSYSHSALQRALQNQDVEYLREVAFTADAARFADRLYERFESYSGEDSGFGILFNTTGDQPDLIRERTPMGSAELENGGYLIGFNIEIRTADEAGELIDNQWVLAKYEQTSSDDPDSWGISSINMIDD